jgi:hypothetical protein
MANKLRDARLAQKARQQKKAEGSNQTPSLPTPSAPAAPSSVVAAPTAISTTSIPGISGYAPQGLTPETDKLSFARIANAMLPYFSGQDQQAVAAFLNTQDPTGMFKNYLGLSLTPNARRVEDVGRSFASADRAAQALANLDAMRTSAGLTEEQLGSGYKLIKQALSILRNFGIKSDQGEQGMTRREYENLQGQLEALNSQAQSDKTLAPYAELATKFINPTLIGTLFPTSTSGGHTIYGQTNKKLFT